ncbi:hypothetical protein IFM89_011042 [Coptis chinensis]|uniref:NAC domain-containing protein n=1 Tax=Coptis chinensis TaxID=261450 RepID=A0A835IPH7_9MAGN|nr:hypothetical protein IFM89_011042 [Coptis chinensis]
MEEVPLELPRGFKFAPTDEELIRYFLAKIFAREPLPELFNNIIMPCELYGSEAFEPWQLLKGGRRRTKFMCLPRLKREMAMVARRSEERLEVKGGHGGSHTAPTS